ncbi:MAG: peptidoglycan-binding domain-containing protein [Albidovulum sp.]
MLLSTKIKKAATVTVTAIALATTAAAPVHAFGKSERKFLQGAVVATAIGALLLQSQKSRSAPVQRRYQPAPQPQYQPQYQTSGPIYSRPINYPSTSAPSVSNTPAARAFNSYTASERRQIQSRLADWGYYQGGIDGSFGPQTFRAITAYANDVRSSDSLTTVGGAYGLFEQLIG